MIGRTMDNGSFSTAISEGPEALVATLESCISDGETPRRLRTEDARTIVEMIMKTESFGRHHLERIITSAQKSSEILWERDEHVGLHAIEFRKLARLYDTIVETAEKKLARLLPI